MNGACVVWALLLDGHGAARALSVDDVARWTPTDGLLWLHIEYGQPGSAEYLSARGLSEELTDLLTRVETRPRSLILQDGCFACLRGVNTNPGADPEDMVSIRVWLEKSRIVTARQRRLLSIQDIQEDLGNGHGPTSPGEFLIDLVERLANRIGTVVNDIEEDMEQQEERLDTQEARQSRADLLETRRQTAVIRRYLGPQRDALSGLYRSTIEILTESHVRHLRDQADRITRYVEDLDLVRERATMIQEELLNRMAEQQNARTYLLSIVAAIFLPLSFLTGVFGMNVAGLPGTETPMSFLLLTLGMTGIAAGIIIWLRMKRWV